MSSAFAQTLRNKGALTTISRIADKIGESMSR